MTREKLAQFLDISRSAAYKWSNEERPFIAFCDRYLDDADVDEFINLGKIEKFEVLTLKKNFDDVFEFLALLFAYSPVLIAFAKFCRQHKDFPRIYVGEFSAASFLFFLPSELEKAKKVKVDTYNETSDEDDKLDLRLGEYELRMFKNAKFACEKYHATFQKIEYAIKLDFLNIVEYFEKNKNENVQFNNQQLRHFDENEFKLFITKYFFPDNNDVGDSKKELLSYYKK